MWYVLNARAACHLLVPGAPCSCWVPRARARSPASAGAHDAAVAARRLASQYQHARRPNPGSRGRLRHALTPCRPGIGVRLVPCEATTTTTHPWRACACSISERNVAVDHFLPALLLARNPADSLRGDTIATNYNRTLGALGELKGKDIGTPFASISRRGYLSSIAWRSARQFASSISNRNPSKLPVRPAPNASGTAAGGAARADHARGLEAPRQRGRERTRLDPHHDVSDGIPSGQFGELSSSPRLLIL
jgi:hypothetical protein